MERIFRRKLLAPRAEGYLPRPRLLDAPDAQVVVAQAPTGAGKTVFLAQWLEHRRRTTLYYELDEHDRDGRVFAAHVAAGLARLWPDWTPPSGVTDDPADLAAELVSEAAGRPPLDVVLDRLECAFGEAYLADFLAVLIRYAPPEVTVALSSRAPLPVDPTQMRRGLRLVTAADLAFTAAEAASLDQENEWLASGGLPLAFDVWRSAGRGWRNAIAARMVAGLPPHVALEQGRALTDEWLAGRLTLSAYAHQVSQAQPGAEALWRDVREARADFLQGAYQEVRERLNPLWEAARGRGDRGLMGAAALLNGEVCFGLGEHSHAMEWYRQAFEFDPDLELCGTHSMVFILRDLGFLDEADALGRRCVEACSARGDLRALAWARTQYGWVCGEMGRFAEAEEQLEEAERIGLTLAAEPFYGIVALMHRAGVAAMQGDIAAYRRLAEKAYTLARGRSPWGEALTGYIYARALFGWGERELAGRLMAQGLEFLTRIDAKYQMHMLHGIMARMLWDAGRIDEARAHFDKGLSLAAAEGYVQLYAQRSAPTVTMILDSLTRGIEVAHCQRLLVRIGEFAVPYLSEVAGRPEPEARKAVLYPLTVIGTDASVEVIRRLLHDADDGVRDGALLALSSLRRKAPAAAAPPVPTAAPTPTPPAAPARLRVAVLGPLEAQVDGQPVQAWRTTKARDLLAYLVLHERPVTRDQLADALWPETTPENAQTLMHTSLYNLRRGLGRAGDGLITFAGGAYRLSRDELELDLDRFQRLAASPNEAAWREAVSLYRGDLLEGLDYPWCEGPRERARSLYLESLRRLAAHLSAAERWTEAAEALQLLVQVDPLMEDGHVALMECYAAQGRRSAAIQQYRTLARLLDEELGLSPSPKADALYRTLLD